MSITDKAAIVGIGTTPFYKRGQSGDQTELELMVKAATVALDDAGLKPHDVDGFSFYAGGFDAGMLATALGIKELRYSTIMSGGGGGSQGTVANAVAAVAAGYADVVLCNKACFSGGPVGVRRGQPRARTGIVGGGVADWDYYHPYGLMSPGQSFALMARKHMDKFGTTTRHFGEVAVSTRFHASRNPNALHRSPITLEDHENSRMIADPLRLLDYCLETDGGTAVIVTSAERAKDLKQKPVYVMGAAMGGPGPFGQGIFYHQMPDEIYHWSGHKPVADRVYAMAGVGPGDIDVAEMYDHFTPLVIMQLEEYGFCGEGEGGPYVENGGIQWGNGRMPVNTHGGNLSEVYLLGLTHTIEGVRQLRGTSTSQVPDAEIALITSGPGILPTSALILRN
ncbi:thiolase C-terminal domain-containing protein [Jatrophihabitans sp. DSM 45814]